MGRGNVRRRFRAGVVVTAVALVMMALAAPAMAEDLTDEQESLAKSVEHELIAPCCWTQTVAEHDSNQSDELKAGIRSMVAAGSTKSEIIDFYKERYGAQILAAPEKSGFNLMAYLFPTLMTLVALGVIVVMLQRWRGREDEVVPVVVESRSEERPSELRGRLEDELEHFDS